MYIKCIIKIHAVTQCYKELAALFFSYVKAPWLQYPSNNRCFLPMENDPMDFYQAKMKCSDIFGGELAHIGNLDHNNWMKNLLQPGAGYWIHYSDEVVGKCALIPGFYK